MRGHLLVVSHEWHRMKNFTDTLVRDTDGLAEPMVLRSPQDRLSATLVGMSCTPDGGISCDQCGGPICLGCDLNTIVDLRGEGERVLCHRCIGTDLWTILAGLYREESPESVIGGR